MSLREEILAANKPRFEKVFIPEWDKHVRIVEMTADARDSFDLKAIDEKNTDAEKARRIRARMVCSCVCDEEGNRIFSDEDIDTLGAGSSTAADRIYDIASRLNRFSKTDVEALAKNS